MEDVRKFMNNVSPFPGSEIQQNKVIGWTPFRISYLATLSTKVCLNGFGSLICKTTCFSAKGLSSLAIPRSGAINSDINNVISVIFFNIITP